MDEEETTEETKKEEPTSNTTDGDKPEATGLIDRGVEAAERLEKANKEAAELLRKTEELAAKRMLSGVSDAARQPPKAPEVTPEEYANAVLEGEVNPFEVKE